MASISMSSPTLKVTCTASASRSSHDSTSVTISYKASGGGGSSSSYTGYNVHVNVGGAVSATLTLNSSGTTWYTKNTKSKSGSKSITWTSGSKSVSFALYHNGSKKGSTSVSLSCPTYWTNVVRCDNVSIVDSSVSPKQPIVYNFSGGLEGANNPITGYWATIYDGDTKIGSDSAYISYADFEVPPEDPGSTDPANPPSIYPVDVGLSEWPAAKNLSLDIQLDGQNNDPTSTLSSNTVMTDDIPLNTYWDTGLETNLYYRSNTDNKLFLNKSVLSSNGTFSITLDYKDKTNKVSKIADDVTEENFEEKVQNGLYYINNNHYKKITTETYSAGETYYYCFINFFYLEHDDNIGYLTDVIANRLLGLNNTTTDEEDEPAESVDENEEPVMRLLGEEAYFDDIIDGEIPDESPDESTEEPIVEPQEIELIKYDCDYWYYDNENEVFKAVYTFNKIGVFDFYMHDGWVVSASTTLTFLESNMPSSSETLNSKIINTTLKDKVYKGNSTKSVSDKNTYTHSFVSNCGIKEVNWQIVSDNVSENVGDNWEDIATTNSINLTYDVRQNPEVEVGIFYKVRCIVTDNTNQIGYFYSDVFINYYDDISITLDKESDITQIFVANDFSSSSYSNAYKYYYKKYLTFNYKFTNVKIGAKLIQLQLGYVVDNNFTTAQTINNYNNGSSITTNINYEDNVIVPAYRICNLFDSINENYNEFYENSNVNNEEPIRFYKYNYSSFFGKISMKPDTSQNKYHPITGYINGSQPGTFSFKIPTNIDLSNYGLSFTINRLYYNNGQLIIDTLDDNKYDINYSIDNKYIELSFKSNYLLENYWFNKDGEYSWYNNEQMNNTEGSITFFVQIQDAFGTYIYNAANYEQQTTSVINLNYDCREMPYFPDDVDNTYIMQYKYKNESIWLPPQGEDTEDPGYNHALFPGDKIRFTFPVQKDENNTYPTYIISYFLNSSNTPSTFQTIKNIRSTDIVDGYYTTPDYTITENISYNINTYSFILEIYDEEIGQKVNSFKYFHYENTKTAIDQPEILFYKPPISINVINNEENEVSNIEYIVNIPIKFNTSETHKSSNEGELLIGYELDDFNNKFPEYINNISYPFFSRKQFKGIESHTGVVYLDIYENNLEGSAPSHSYSINSWDSDAEPSYCVDTRFINYTTECDIDSDSEVIYLKLRVEIDIYGTDIKFRGKSNDFYPIAWAQKPTVSYRKNRISINSNNLDNSSIVSIKNADENFKYISTKFLTLDKTQEYNTSIDISNGWMDGLYNSIYVGNNEPTSHEGRLAYINNQLQIFHNGWKIAGGVILGENNTRNGLYYVGNDQSTLGLHLATTQQPGAVSTTTQGFGGLKQFNDGLSFPKENDFEMKWERQQNGNLSLVLMYREIMFNQLVQNGNFEDTSGWNKGGSGDTFSVSSNIATIKASARYGGIWCSALIPQGHKFYLTGWIKSSSPSTIRLQAKGVNNVNVNITPTASTDWQVLEALTTHTEDIVRFVVMDIATSGWADFYCKNAMLIDLTQMFGVGNEPTTVEEVKALFPDDYYEYNIGTTIRIPE